jgi:hypothetical protein
MMKEFHMRQIAQFIDEATEEDTPGAATTLEEAEEEEEDE